MTDEREIVVMSGGIFNKLNQVLTSGPTNTHLIIENSAEELEKTKKMLTDKYKIQFAEESVDPIEAIFNEHNEHGLFVATFNDRHQGFNQMDALDDHPGEIVNSFEKAKEKLVEIMLKRQRISKNSGGRVDI